VVLPTGTEVVAPGSGPLEPGQIYDINTTTLLAFLKEFGAEAQAHPGVADEIDALRQAVSSLTEPELLILTGGSSVGERDLLAEVFSEVGEILFHGIAVKPGKPTLMARRKEGGQLLLGMPGYPTSCLSNAYILLGPIVAHVGRRPAPRLKIVEVPLAEPVKSTPDRFQVLTVTLSGGQAYPAFKTSSAITSMSQADGYIEIPQGCAGLEAGSTVLVKLF
jgi:molybdenum cofactor synthesis domain-containing protein